MNRYICLAAGFADCSYPVEYAAGTYAVELFNNPLSAGIVSFTLSSRPDAAQGEIRLYEMRITHQEV